MKSMPVPDYQTLMLPVLKLFASGKERVSDCIDDLKLEFDISDEDAAELLPSGRMTRLYSRAHWARTYLGKAGLLTSPKRGYHRITKAGRDVLATNPARIDNQFLEPFGNFAAWQNTPSGEKPNGGDGLATAELPGDQTPEDVLGLDAVYIQAKRYAPDNKVGRPDIQRFVGSLTGESATKGVFVTTSSFSREAHAYIERVQQRIVLIDGSKLAQLMIAHEVGVRTRSAYRVKSLDEDYFSDV